MRTDLKRRLFLKYLLAKGTITTAICTGLITPHSALAAWPKKAFEATTIPTALNALLGSDKTRTRRYATEVKTRPHMNNSGTQVTVTITTTIPEVDSITLLATSNQTPLVACFNFGGRTIDSLATRIKMEGKGEVIVILKSGDRLFSEQTEVDFSGCGCG
ncbi:MAG: thiosulfate oxidation carrier protein SoxY [Gammaproteobacteria bacterium]|nr:thiosulfate oxidation carrier protein SoxY [Gammaproteobacteria bacterium]